MLIYRPAMEVKFGANPTVSTRITVKYKGGVEEDQRENVIWYDVVQASENDSRRRVENTSSHAGYQYNL